MKILTWPSKALASERRARRPRKGRSTLRRRITAFTRLTDCCRAEPHVTPIRTIPAQAHRHNPLDDHPAGFAGPASWSTQLHHLDSIAVRHLV